MLLNILEILMIILYVLARCAATVAICYYVLINYGDGEGKFWIIVIAIIVGLGFSLKYENPNNTHPPTSSLKTLSVPEQK